MSEGQQPITEYPRIDDRDEPDAGIEADPHDTVRFDIVGADGGSIQRVREQHIDIAFTGAKCSGCGRPLADETAYHVGGIPYCSREKCKREAHEEAVATDGGER